VWIWTRTERTKQPDSDCPSSLPSPLLESVSLSVHPLTCGPRLPLGLSPHERLLPRRVSGFGSVAYSSRWAGLQARCSHSGALRVDFGSPHDPAAAQARRWASQMALS
jgi:hypothetical protein